jgi:hypothetical protein
MAENPLTTIGGYTSPSVPSIEQVSTLAEKIYNYLGPKVSDTLQQILTESKPVQTDSKKTNNSFEIDPLEPPINENEIPVYDNVVDTSRVEEQQQFIKDLQIKIGDLESHILKLSDQKELIIQQNSDNTELTDDYSKQITAIDNEIKSLQDLSLLLVDQQNISQQKLNGALSLIDETKKASTESFDGLKKIIEGITPDTLSEEITEQLTPYLSETNNRLTNEFLLLKQNSLTESSELSPAKQLNIKTGEITEVPRATPVFKSEVKEQQDPALTPKLETQSTQDIYDPEDLKWLAEQEQEQKSLLQEVQEEIIKAEEALNKLQLQLKDNTNDSEKNELQSEIKKIEAQLQQLLINKEEKEAYSTLFQKVVNNLTPVEENFVTTIPTVESKTEDLNSITNETITNETILPESDETLQEPEFYYDTDKDTGEIIRRDSKTNEITGYGEIINNNDELEQNTPFLIETKQSEQTSTTSALENNSSPNDPNYPNQKIDEAFSLLAKEMKKVQESYIQPKKTEPEITPQVTDQIDSDDNLKPYVKELPSLETTSEKSLKPDIIQAESSNDFLSEIKDLFKTFNIDNSVIDTSEGISISTPNTDVNNSENFNLFKKFEPISELTTENTFSQLNDNDALLPDIFGNTETIISLLAETIKILPALAAGNNVNMSTNNSINQDNTMQLPIQSPPQTEPIRPEPGRIPNWRANALFT